MAVSTIIRRAVSTVAPLAVRAQRNYSSAITSTPLKNNLISQELRQKTFRPSVQFFSSAVAKKSPSSYAYEKLVRLIESNNECAEGEDIPAGPFTIEDNPGEPTITLTREYKGEVVKFIFPRPDSEEEDDDDGVDGDKGSQSSIPLVVTVSKENGPCLEFSVTIYPDEFSIDGLYVKQPESSENQISYEELDFKDLDEKMQKAFHEYLKIRGLRAIND